VVKQKMHMSDFSIFFSTGIKHIIDPEAIDHISFVTVLCLRYVWSDWKKILVLVTAFTIGHSITLALSTLNIINIPTRWSEFLIAITILITALNNTSVKNFQFKRKYPLIYFYALVFGLIHGLGFSTALKSMLGKDQSIIVQLLAFNLGLEVGQIIIVSIVLLVSFIFVTLLKVNRRDYVLFISGAVAMLSVQMAIERFPVKNKNDDEKTTGLFNHAVNHYSIVCTRHSKQPGLQPWQQV
jgi:hypothetical protein